MKTWKQCCEDVGYTPYFDPPAPIRQYYAYKAGKVIECATQEEAKKISDNYDYKAVNQQEIDAYKAARNALYGQAAAVWDDALRGEYGDLPLAVFNLCYGEAYERGHADGYDEIANYMASVVNFAGRILKAAQ